MIFRDRLGWAESRWNGITGGRVASAVSRARSACPVGESAKRSVRVAVRVGEWSVRVGAPFGRGGSWATRPVAGWLVGDP